MRRNVALCHCSTENVKLEFVQLRRGSECACLSLYCSANRSEHHVCGIWDSSQQDLLFCLLWMRPGIHVNAITYFFHIKAINACSSDINFILKF